MVRKFSKWKSGKSIPQEQADVALNNAVTIAPRE
jgi:hypothetical protein